MSKEKSKKHWTNWHHKLHKDLLNKKELIPNETNLLIAVSGGQDSMALLTLFNDLKPLYNWTIDVWHGNHNWHEQSGIYAKELKDFCEESKIHFHLDIANSIDVSSEDKSRQWRYLKLEQKAKELRLKRKLKNNFSILTGHTSTDNAETFFLNLARGSSYNGLGGIKKKSFLNNNYSLIRPFLIFNREDTSAICRSLGVPIWEDPTNSDTTIKRNLIRHEIIPKLETIYPGCTCRINNFIEKMNKFSNEQSDLSKLALIACKEKNHINRTMFNRLCEEARSTILNQAIKENCIKQISSINLKIICQKISQKQIGSIDLPDGLKLTWTNHLISFEH